jgi:hypothetical protein
MRIGKLKKEKMVLKEAGRVEANLRRGYARRSLSGLVGKEIRQREERLCCVVLQRKKERKRKEREKRC